MQTCHDGYKILISEMAYTKNYFVMCVDKQLNIAPMFRVDWVWGYEDFCLEEYSIF
jgi:hypothetical protein